MRLTNEFTLKTGTLEELNEIISQPNFKGVIKNLPAHLYHTCLGISRSSLNALDQSFEHYLEERANPKPPTRDMTFGSGFHDYTMLPEEFKANFAIMPNNKVEGMLITAEDLKKHLLKFYDSTADKIELEAYLKNLEEIKAQEEADGIKLEAQILELDNSLPSNEESLAKYEEELKVLDESKFESKKAFQDEQKKIKASITEVKNAIKSLQVANKAKAKELKDAHKEKFSLLSAPISEKIVATKATIKEKDSKLSGTKEVLTDNIREVDKETPIWDEVFKKFEAESVGKQAITHDDFLRILKMDAKVKTHPTIDSLFHGKDTFVLYETTFFWVNSETGLLCKCRPDILIFNPNMILPADYKTTEDASKGAFERSIYKFHYHIQAPFYIDGINEVLGFNVQNFMFIPVEKTAPHGVALYALNSISIAEGRNCYNKHLKTLQLFSEELKKDPDTWVGYPIEVQDVSIPTYAFKLEA